jgi:hypothetical protein
MRLGRDSNERHGKEVMRHQMEVIGDDDVDGYDVMGYDVMGYDPVVAGPRVRVFGYDDDGTAIVGRARHARPRPQGGMVQVNRPSWRDGQLAPGVIAPDQGLLPLPMGTFNFTATAQTNTFTGQVQKPFRGERWLIRVVRTGTSAVGTILALIFVGTDLAMLDTNPVDLESLANPAAFGVRLTMKPAQPGVSIKAICTLGTALTSTDTINVTLQLLGRNIH